MRDVLANNSIVQGVYQVMDHINTGGTSFLYEVKDKNNRNAVLKVIQSPTTLNKIQLKNEASILAHLSHDKIPSLLDKFILKENYEAIVIEKLPGKDVRQWIEREKRNFTWEELLSIAKQLANIIQDLHRGNQKVIIRDLKPANIMLTLECDVSLIDFGASWMETNRLSQAYALGSIGFAAPEQFETGVIEERSDLFSMGAVLFYMATGGKNIFTTEFSILNEIRIPKAFKQIIRTLTQTEPSERYRSIETVIQDLDTVKPTFAEWIFLAL